MLIINEYLYEFHLSTYIFNLQNILQTKEILYT